MPAVSGMRPIHPGEILREEFLLPMNLTAHALAMALRLPAPRINDVVRERRGVSADTALRLARYFGTSAEFWLGLQVDFDLKAAQRAAGKTIEREIVPMAIAT
jgi:addiction module HigA family antidote